MPDDTTTTEGQTATTDTTAAGSGAGSTPRSIDGFPEEAQDYIRRLRQENASHRNELKDTRTRLKEFEDRDKTELERAQGAAQSAEARIAAAELRATRYEIAAEVGLPLKFAARLQGSTKDELKADAEALKKDFGIDGTEETAPQGGDRGAGVRRSVERPKSMNGLIRAAAGRA